MCRNTVYIVALVLCSAVYSHGDADACRVATRISIENLRYRLASPTVEPDRVQRAFAELAALHKRCSSVTVHQRAEDCSEVAKAVRQNDQLDPEQMAVFKKVTGCELPLAQGKTSTQPPDLNHLITQTLHEQQASDGEASYWIADDLLALLLVYPDEVIENILGHPSFRERFISDLGGEAFEDLDDRQGSTHRVLHEKMRVFAELLSRLRHSHKDQADRAKLISDLARACRCTH